MKRTFYLLLIFLLFKTTALYSQGSIKSFTKQLPRNIFKGIPTLIPTPVGIIASFSGGFEHFINQKSSIEIIGVRFQFFASEGNNFSDHGPMFHDGSETSIKLGYNRYFRPESTPNFSYRIGVYSYTKLKSQSIGIGGLGGFRIDLHQQKWFLDLALGLSVFYSDFPSSLLIGPRPIIHIGYVLN